jgi:peptide/nickel transport system permease protein
MSGTRRIKDSPGGAGKTAGEETVLLSVPNWKRTLSRWRRSFGRGWRLFKQSKAGLLGLGIMFGFVFMAVFAPWIAPYDLDFLAPQEDVFKADNVNEVIVANESLDLLDPESENWKTPFGFSGLERMEEIIVYSDGGHAIKYVVDDKAIEGGRGLQIVSNSTHEIPRNITRMFQTSFILDHFTAFTNDMIYELTFDTLSIRFNASLPFEPIWFSNVWNRWGPRNAEGEYLHCWANETHLLMYARIPPNPIFGEFKDRRFFDVMSMDDFNVTNGTKIIGEPIMLNIPFLTQQPNTVNGSMIVIPTNKGIVAIKLDYNESNNRVRWVRIGEPMWFVSYEEIGEYWGRETVEPIADRPITIAKDNPSETLGKDRIILATNSQYLYSVRRMNGTMDWTATLVARGMREPRPIGLWPTFRGFVVVTGTSESLGFIASVDPESGDIKGNRTWYNMTTSAIVGQPDYIPSSRNYIFMTESQQIVILKETMQLDATFQAVGTGTDTTISYVGNIVNNVGSSQGNYYSMVTRDAIVWVQSVSGTYTAPLPPGVGPSGNRYILGTDVFGGDIFTQLVYAARTELVVGLVAAIISAGLGTIVGLMAGFYGRWVDVLLMRLTDIFLTLPILVVALLLAAVLGPSIGNIILIIAIFSWAGVARVIRAQTLSLKNRSFIDAARVSGASNRAIIFRHLAPNVLPLTFLYMVFTISGAIITEAILAFLGMGDPTAVTWGMMLQFLQISGNTLTAWWWLLPPGISITMLSLAFYLIGRAFDEVVNPRLRAR